jgi:hypothetical protein
VLIPLAITVRPCQGCAQRGKPMGVAAMIGANGVFVCVVIGVHRTGVISSRRSY